MPSIYTHDVFGQRILLELPKELQRTLIKYKTQFRIGLQGPDILFFHRPLLKTRANRFGHKQHNTPARFFFEPIKPLLQDVGYDSPEYAYIVGFLCHFMLDSACHGYVNKKAKK